MHKSISISAFADIVDLDDDQIREIIARVGRDDLTIALKAAAEPLKDRILGCMTEESGQALSQLPWRASRDPRYRSSPWPRQSACVAAVGAAG